MVSQAPVCWFGPVSRKQARPAVPEGYPLVVLPCTGDGSDGGPRCQDHADSMKGSDGRRLAELRRRLKLPPGPIVVAAFSAGGQVIKRLALDPDDRRELAAVYLADATYTTAWAVQGKQAGLEPITMGFVSFAELALQVGRPFVATASTGANRSYPNGAQTLAAIRAEIERRTGRTFEDARLDPMLEGLRPPVRADRLGTILFVDWGAVYQHGEHATAIAPVMLPRMLEQLGPDRWLEQFDPALMAPPAPPAPASARAAVDRPRLPRWAWIGAGVTVAAAAAWWLRRL